MEFKLENPIGNSDDSSWSWRTLFLAECDHTPSSVTSLHLSPIRLHVISLILHFCTNFHPFLSYLSINYLHRFLSTQHNLELNKPWILRLLAVSCVSLAIKMRQDDADLSLSDIQQCQCECDGGGGLIYDSETIERMELLILGVLKWRMRSITPFAFIQLFISLFIFKDSPSTHALKARATQIILTSQNDLKLIEFRPSIISASALLTASHELFPLQFQCYKTAIFNASFLNKDNFWRCYNIVQEIAMEGYVSILEILVSSSSTSNVLQLPASSSPTSSSDNDTTTHTLKLENDLKRRKINVFTSEKCILALPDQSALLNC